MISRRTFLRNMIAGSLLLAGCRPSENHPSEASASATPAAGLLHRFGSSETRAFQRLYAAGPPAEVLLYALAPERLVGWTTQKRPQTLEMLGENARSLPVLGGINGRGTPASVERLLAEKIDAVVDVGVVNDSTVSTAEQTAKQLGVPYLLLEGRLAQSVEQIRQLGGLLASSHTENLATLAEQALLFAAREAAARAAPVSVYLARGRDGLETGRRDSIHTEVAAMLGAQSVGDALEGGGLAQVSLEQILLWQPDWVLTQDADFAAEAARNPLWQKVNAVREGRIGLLPRLPYGWIDGPPGINRLPGIYALAAVLSGQPVSRHRDRILPLLEALYHHHPTAAQQRMLGLV
ncbi:ABC transporter substrate-binding protein [Eikenella sp. S3360]|uniref:ABC transporter substrate-binding protein n=1 Tax=Eikenella glucosivorans TaxID=2766967 RepID=A0ABS0N844_9NEIS|nr:ABC transporter substrate-binding protein [Eikenella glucosivorans]MBH5328468.1 ABC transporter substrate-binding protein [Eikenella glucosivorans]